MSPNGWLQNCAPPARASSCRIAISQYPALPRRSRRGRGSLRVKGSGSSQQRNPMIGMVLVTHGRLAAEFVAALEHVVGAQTQIAAICIGPDDDMEERRRRSCALLPQSTQATAPYC